MLTPRTARSIFITAQWWILLSLCAQAGCAGHGTINLVSLNMTEIDPPQARSWEFSAQEACWWTDESGELSISLQNRERNILLGKFGASDFGLSFVFDSPPAGRARNYKITSRDFRGQYVSALANQRYVPVSGIVGVVMGKDGVLRGSYRVWVTSVGEASILAMMPQRAGSVLVYGTFEAVKDERRGKAIRDFCESKGFVRAAKNVPTTKPTTKPAG